MGFLGRVVLGVGLLTDGHFRRRRMGTGKIKLHSYFKI